MMLRAALVIGGLVLAQGLELKDCDSSNGWCYGYFGSGASEQWCWLSDGYGNYAIPGMPYQCKSWDGYSTTTYCKGGFHESERQPKSDLQSVLDNAKGSQSLNAKVVCESLGYSFSSSLPSTSWPTVYNIECGTHSLEINCHRNGLTGAITYCAAQKMFDPAPAPSYQPAPAPSPAPSPAPGPSPSASGLGTCISDFARAQDGQKVGSDATGHRQTECWDLAMAAIEHCRKKGYKIPASPSSYVWSQKSVPYKQALPGDIAQFVSWSEKVTYPGGGWGTRSTGPRHTAVVTKAYKDCELEMHDQNPSPVKRSVYHPCSPDHQGGTLIIYRLSANARLEELGEDPVPEEYKQNEMPSPMVVTACGAGLIIMASVGLMVWRLKSRRSGFGYGPHLCVEMEEKDKELSEVLE